MEKLDGWCCTDCEENFYLPVGSVDTNKFMVICPYCANWKYTVCNTIKKED